jgi:uncharacterized membrane protein
MPLFTTGRTLNQAPRPNVGYYERWVSAVAGGALAAVGLRRAYHRSPIGLGLLALAGHQIYRGITGQDRIYRGLGIETIGITGPGGESRAGIKVATSVTIDRGAQELYDFWRNFENLPQFMKHLESVRVQDAKRSHWVAKAPAGTTVEWDAEITEDRPGEQISWRSLPNADVSSTGSVRFVPAGDRGTEVHVVLEYSPPGGSFGAAVAKVFGEEPEQQVSGDLLRFKNLMEAGEIPTTSGQPHGQRSALGKILSPTS